MHRANPRTRQHRNRQLGNHRHVQRHPISRLHPQLLQHIRKLTHLAMQVLIPQHASIPGFPFPDNRGFVSMRPQEVTVHTVIAGVDPASDKPLSLRHLPLQHRVPAPKPVQVLRHLSPETSRIVLRPLPHGVILLLTANVRLRRKCCRRGKGSRFLKHTLNTLAAGRTHAVNCSCVMKSAL